MTYSIDSSTYGTYYCSFGRRAAEQPNDGKYASLIKPLDSQRLTLVKLHKEALVTFEGIKLGEHYFRGIELSVEESSMFTTDVLDEFLCQCKFSKEEYGYLFSLSNEKVRSLCFIFFANMEVIVKKELVVAIKKRLMDHFHRQQSIIEQIPKEKLEQSIKIIERFKILTTDFSNNGGASLLNNEEESEFFNLIKKYSVYPDFEYPAQRILAQA